MSDLLDDASAGPNSPEFTVTDLSGAIKQVIEGAFSHVRIRGEIGRVSRPRSGHIYLDLKDDRSVISGVIWKGVAARLATQPEEGLEVIATGRITTFGGQSKYQVVIEDIEPAGAGALMAMLEKRKALLQAEGLFDSALKKKLPYLPEVIGVVTSPSGAVIRDILHRLRDRFPRKVLIWPVAVQGTRCAPEVVNAIKGFNAMTPGGSLPRPDVLIIARGGGSVEDLWGFNEEAVARAAAASDIPLISAVGHETDTTLIDFVSDVRAPTPTAAAELSVPVRHELLAWVDAQDARRIQAISGTLSRRRERLRDLSRAMPRSESLLETPRQRLDIWSTRLPSALIHGVQRRKVDLSERSGSLRPAVLTRLIASERRRLGQTGQRLKPTLGRVVDIQKERFETRAAQLQRVAPQQNIMREKERLSALIDRFSATATQNLEKLSDRLTALDRLRETLGYQATLERGFAVVRSGDQLVTTAKAAKSAGSLDVQFADGVHKIGGAPAKAKKPVSKPLEQGTLFGTDD